MLKLTSPLMGKLKELGKTDSEIEAASIDDIKLWLEGSGYDLKARKSGEITGYGLQKLEPEKTKPSKPKEPKEPKESKKPKASKDSKEPKKSSQYHWGRHWFGMWLLIVLLLVGMALSGWFQLGTTDKAPALVQEIVPVLANDSVALSEAQARISELEAQLDSILESLGFHD